MGKLQGRSFRRLACLSFAASAFGSAVSAHASSKMTVCTITINSDDEKIAFENHLGKKDFDFVELLPSASGKGAPDEPTPEGSWLLHYCHTHPKTQCDLILISGHFAGGFIGDHGSLALSSLQEASCDPACEGVMKNPREVFLFGCNTLAKRDPDTRTPEVYLRDLLRDHIPREQAEMDTELRYGKLGMNTQEQIRHIFSKVPHIYGFNSRAPLGVEIYPSLNDYLDRIPDYAAHLEREAVQSMVNTVEGLNRTRSLPARNRALASALAKTSFQECPGNTFVGEGDDYGNFSCALQSQKLPISEKLELIRSVIARGDFNKYFQPIKVFVNDADLSRPDQKEKSILKRIAGYRKVRARIMAQIKEIRLLAPRLSLMGTAAKLGLLSPEDATELGMSDFKKFLADPRQLSVGELAAFGFQKIDFRGDALTPEVLKMPGALVKIGSTLGRDPALLDKLVDIATHSATQDDLDSGSGLASDAVAALASFADRGASGAESRIYEMLAAKNPSTQALAMRAADYTHHPPSEQRSMKALIAAIGNKDLCGDNPYAADRLVRLAVGAQSRDPEIRKRIYHQAVRAAPKVFSTLGSSEKILESREAQKVLAQQLVDFTSADRFERRQWALLLVSTLSKRSPELTAALKSVAGHATEVLADEAYQSQVQDFLDEAH